jgi:predicted NBD/HSP70 family sugar kinase
MDPIFEVRVRKPVRREIGRFLKFSVRLLTEKFGRPMLGCVPIVEPPFRRQTHADRVLAALRARGALRRGELAAFIGVSRSTLSEVTGDLIRRGAIAVVSTDANVRSGSGRPAELLALDPRSGQFMGVDFGHNRVHVALADAAHEIIAAGQAQYLSSTTWSQRLEVAFELIGQLTADTGTHLKALQGVAVGIAGRYSASWDQAHVLVPPAFLQRYGVSVLTEANVRFAALAEAMYASGNAVRDLLFVRISDGVGGGLVADQRIVQGGSGIAGEIGHITVDHNGRPCRCGKRGCLETVASVPAILAECTRRGVEVTSIGDLERAFERAEPVVDAVLREAASAVGRVLAAAALIANPSEVVIEGPLVRIIPGFVALVAATVTYEVHSIAGARPSIRAAQLSDEAGAIGAIAALLQSSLPRGHPESAGHPPHHQRSMP